MRGTEAFLGAHLSHTQYSECSTEHRLGKQQALNVFCCRHCSALQCNQVALMTQIQPGCVEQESISSLEALVTHASLPHSFGGLGTPAHLQEVKNISKQMIMQPKDIFLRRM